MFVLLACLFADLALHNYYVRSLWHEEKEEGFSSTAGEYVHLGVSLPNL